MEYHIDTARDCTDEYRSVLIGPDGKVIGDVTDCEYAEQMLVDLNGAAAERARADAAEAKVAELERQRAAMAAALDRLARLGNEPNYGNSIGNDIARHALSASGLECVPGWVAKRGPWWSFSPMETGDHDRPAWLVFEKEADNG